MGCAEETILGAGRDHLVLAEEDRVIRSEPLALLLNEPSIRREVAVDLPPADFVVPGMDGLPGGIAGAVRGGVPFEQRGAVPGRAEEHRGSSSGGGHRPELTVEPVRIEVLRFVADEEQGGGVPGDAGEWRATEEDGARRATAQGVSVGCERESKPARMSAEAGSGPLEADGGLGTERGCADDDAAAAIGVGAEQPRDEGGRDFVLARLAGEHDGEGFTGVARDVPAQGAQDTGLIAAKAGVGRHLWRWSPLHRPGKTGGRHRPPRLIGV